jgi:cytochrome c-type biogenesis protein CcmF
VIGLAALCLAGALGLALILLLLAGQSGWRPRSVALLVRPWLIAAWILLTVGLTAEMADGLRRPTPVGWALVGAWLVAVALVIVADRRRGAASPALRRWGARVALAGIAVALGGLLLSSLFTSTIERRLSIGETTRIGAWTVQLNEVWPAAGEGWAGLVAELRASSGGGAILIEPERRWYLDGSDRSHPATIASGTGTLRASLGRRGEDRDWPIRFDRVPLLMLIPIGGAIAALGGAIMMIGPSIARWRRRRHAQRAMDWWA